MCATPAEAQTSPADATLYGSCDAFADFVPAVVAGQCTDAIPTRDVKCMVYDAAKTSYSFAPNGNADCAVITTVPTSTEPTYQCAKGWRCAPSADLVTYQTMCDDNSWSQCTVQCPTATQVRDVQCVNELGAKVTGCVDTEESPKPQGVKTCEASPVLQKVSVSSSKPKLLGSPQVSAVPEVTFITVGQPVTVSWCYYDVNPAEVNVAITVESDSSSIPRLLVSKLVSVGVNSASFTLPVIPSGDANVVISIGSVVSEPVGVSVTPGCRVTSDFCGPNGFCNFENSKCVCDRGYSGTQCGSNVCDLCVGMGTNTVDCTPGATYPNQPCNCAEGFEGKYCEIKTVCDNSVCKNDGYLVFTGNEAEGTTCGSACGCRNEWTGDSCDTCSLTCSGDDVAVVRGKPDAECAKCVCNRGYFGAACECRQAFGSIVLNGVENYIIDDYEWQTVLKSTIAVITQHAVDRLAVTVADYDNKIVVITFTDCEQSNVPVEKSLWSFLVKTQATSLDTIYKKWDLVVEDIKSPNSVLKSTVLSTAVLSAAITPTAAAEVYDPACTGDGCAAGTNPFPYYPDNASTQAMMSILTIGMVMVLPLLALLM